MDIRYVHALVPSSVEENFEGYFHDHDDLTIAQILQDQETVYQSLQRNAHFNTDTSSSATLSGDPDDRLQRHGNSSQTLNAETRLSLDEAFARELQELENQLSYNSLNQTSGVGSDVTHVQSPTSSSQGNSSSNTSQVAREDDIDPDNMTYEELQSLGEAIRTKSRGLSDVVISYLPVSTYKIGLFSKKEKHEECVICYMTYKNRDKLITLPCEHQYHKDCVTQWLRINKACPVCNKEVFGS